MKKIKSIFLAVYSVVALFLIGAYHSNLFSPELILGIVIAVLLNLLNLISAVYAFEKSILNTNKQFLIYNMGGMSIRLFVLLIALLLILKFLNIDKDGFILIFFIFYFVQLTAEIGYFSSYIKGLKQK
ncbi:MAG: hypothetical protein CVV23_11840 [Ignavibacteriae bacterium HGW-Ignavibacteriae-2]|nr:hypothetical protein [Bacteroidota bacterium]PKL88127.1 MAG: hypothetical protein CVV23_11840 [Ignavibacteriae bacterium HGW-Ignavibacteriae-2]